MKIPMHIIVTVGQSVVTAAIETVHGTAVGEAKCHPNDLFNARLGEQVAVARALSQLGENIMMAAEEKIYPRVYLDDVDEGYDLLNEQVPF